MTRADLHKKYGITRILPPKKLYEELTEKEAVAYEKHLQAITDVFEHWDEIVSDDCDDLDEPGSEYFHETAKFIAAEDDIPF